jgi:tetratricopeptide (TPR) repeat protein
MIYHCDRCRAVLPGGAKTCPQCGRVFDAPVPTDSPNASVDALLRRTANARPAPPSSAPNSNFAPNTNPAPAWYGSTPNAGAKRPVWLFVTAGVIAVLGLVIWGANTLWMRGTGGEIAFRQHNSAGNAAAERGDFATADNEYGQMIALRPQRVDGYLLRAINETLEGKTTEAIDDNTTALTLARGPMMRGDLFYNRAEAYAKQGKLTRAISDFTAAHTQYAQVRNPRLLGEVPDRQEGVYSLRADAYWQRKQYALSIQDSKAAIALGHAHPDDYGVQAKAEAALGQDQAAQADFQQALRLDPAYLDGYIGLGNLAEKQHQYVQAAAVYQKAVQAAPSNAQFWGSLGWFQYENGQNSQALASDRHAQSLDPNQGWVNYNIALTYAAVGQSAQAQAAYSDALASGTAADQKAGIADIRHALVRQPGSAALRQALAQVQSGSIGGPRTARILTPPPPLPASKPPAAPARFAAFLAPEVVLNGYGIQPPAGYTLTRSRSVTLTGISAVYLWSGPRRADGTVPTLQAVVGQDDGSLAAHSTQRQVAQDALSDMGNNHSGLRVSAVSAVTLGALSFDEGTWDGIGQQTGKEYQGSEYWSVSPSHVIHLSSHDAFPYSRTTLPLLKASIMTFRKM